MDLQVVLVVKVLVLLIVLVTQSLISPYLLALHIFPTATFLAFSAVTICTCS